MTSSLRRETPIIATRSFGVFEVVCEATKEWLTLSRTTFVSHPGESKEEMQEALKKAEYQFHKVTNENGECFVTPPVGFWLKGDRLVSPEVAKSPRCAEEEGEVKAAYYGTREEIIARRNIAYIEY